MNGKMAVVTVEALDVMSESMRRKQPNTRSTIVQCGVKTFRKGRRFPERVNYNFELEFSMTRYCLATRGS